jgi:hypothetical protein
MRRRRIFAEHGFAAREHGAHRAGVTRVDRDDLRIFPGRKAAIYRAIQEERGTAILGPHSSDRRKRRGASAAICSTR